MGASQNPALKELHHRLGQARVELQAAKEEDGVVVSRQHVEGAAFKSGRISNGDIISKVDGVSVGECHSAWRRVALASSAKERIIAAREVPASSGGHSRLTISSSSSLSLSLPLSLSLSLSLCA